MNANNPLITRLKTTFEQRPKLVFFPMLFIGILILMLSIALKPKLAVTTGNGATKTVDIMPLERVNIAPEATGFGQIQPKHQWSAIAEVTGEILYKSPLLSKGEYIPAGTELLRIDPLKYELALAQAEADLKSHELELTKLEQEQDNLATNLKIEQRRLALTKAENTRLTKLTKQGLFSQSNLDDQSLELLALEKAVQEITQNLALFENEKSVAVAQINLSKASVEEAVRSLNKTVISAPRNIKVAQVDIEQNQVVNLNQTMLIGHALEVMEVEAQVSMNDMHVLISSVRKSEGNITVTPEILSKITASIVLNSGNVSQRWPANVTRISETIDPTQATVGVILEVSQDLEHLKVGRPPLLNGMFIKATLSGLKSEQFSIPEKALHTNNVYLMSADDTLNIVPIKVLYRTKLATVIDGDLTSGSKLILNDLLPAVQGMKLAMRDTQTQSSDKVSGDNE